MYLGHRRGRVAELAACEKITIQPYNFVAGRVQNRSGYRSDVALMPCQQYSHPHASPLRLRFDLAVETKNLIINLASCSRPQLRPGTLPRQHRPGRLKGAPSGKADPQLRRSSERMCRSALLYPIKN